MKLSRASDYALHALAYLAAQKQDSVVPSHVIAKDGGYPTSSC
jgi:DNA-binding IscR family transcriptional regulator